MTMKYNGLEQEPASSEEEKLRRFLLIFLSVAMPLVFMAALLKYFKFI